MIKYFLYSAPQGFPGLLHLCKNKTLIKKVVFYFFKKWNNLQIHAIVLIIALYFK